MKIDRVPFVDLGRQFSDLEQQLTDGFRSIGRSGQFILGPHVETFEHRIASYCQTKFAVSCGNGSDALFLSLKALGIGAGAEVIIPVNSFVATAWVVVAAGAIPRFVDVSEDMNIDVAQLAGAITDRTKAIIPVHLTGRPAPMEEILRISNHHGLAIVEDSAQAVGAKLNGRSVGSFGDAAGFSLHPLKNLGVLGDGGFITTNREDLYENLLKLRNHGLIDRDHCTLWGYNSRLDALQAYAANEKLSHLDRWNNRCREIAAKYRQALQPFVSVPIDAPGEYSVYHNFVINTEHRDQLRAHLGRRNVGSNIHYPIPLHLQDAARQLGYRRGDFPRAERFAQTMLSLPIFPELTDDEVDYVIATILEFFDSNLDANL
jgi:dTDP-4-amino-4,6-dideoxygalactose transaminase